ncbi:AEC family transporter [Paracoccus alkenifer]|uniref:Transporter n=1 Tax=Paracoccus alkenifer TaxID=65735 RepID=A0A1H6LDZ7_9RHOB|nr:AEC family transporter [Paracoccus alkenifer]SEH83466.1 hypothetical protein SAMN04488075_1335 [Paracoccus alkenifer]
MTMAILLALAPIILLIALGAGLSRRGFRDAGFWAQAERLSYFILLPSLFFHGLATADIGALPFLRLAAVLVAAILVVAGLTLLVRRPMGIDGPGFTSVFQGSIRFNNYVAVTLSVGLVGSSGVALAAVCNAIIVPTVNILSILVLARHGRHRPGPGAILRQLATNPLLLASAAGLGFQAAGLGLPPGVAPALRSLGAAALPMGLLCVGAALQFSGARRWLVPVAASSALKFGAMPLVTLALAQAVGLTGEALVAALVFQVMPTASSSYILARQLGGDHALMAGITAAQTLIATVAVPVMLIALLG